MSPLWMLAALPALALIALAALTVRGGRVRGHGWPVAVVGGVFFPLTWLVWYMNDDPRRAPRSPSV